MSGGRSNAPRQRSGRGPRRRGADRGRVAARHRRHSGGPRGDRRRARREDRRQGPGQEQGAERQADRAAQEARRRRTGSRDEPGQRQCGRPARGGERAQQPGCGVRRRSPGARRPHRPTRAAGLRPMASTEQHTHEEPGRLGDEGAAPDGPTDLKARSWRGVLSRTVREFKEDNLTVWAAALTYYGILAIFPAIIALVSILGLIGPSATQPLLDNVSQVAPGPAKDILTS